MNTRAQASYVISALLLVSVLMSQLSHAAPVMISQTLTYVPLPLADSNSGPAGQTRSRSQDFMRFDAGLGILRSIDISLEGLMSVTLASLTGVDSNPLGGLATASFLRRLDFDVFTTPSPATPMVNRTISATSSLSCFVGGFTSVCRTADGGNGTLDHTLTNTVSFGSGDPQLSDFVGVNPFQIRLRGQLNAVCTTPRCSRAELRGAYSGEATVKYTYVPNPVPTPSAMLLMATGMFGLVGWRWWHTKTA